MRTTIGTRGYGRTGIGSEIAIGEAVIGTVATGLRAVKISDLSRVRRFNATVQNSVADERQSRSIALPGLKGAMSHLAMPIRCQKRLVGVLLVESRNRMAFGHAAEVLAEAMARLAGAAGRLLMLILELHLKERRVDFTNRELRWHDATRLPDFKDNLETRLLVLRRRLDEKQVPLRLARVGRGQLRLDLQGFPAIPHL